MTKNSSRHEWQLSTQHVRLATLGPQEASLWDVSAAPTIVMTQRGARAAFQAQLRDRGVEVVQFDFLTPEAVAAYCYERGFLQVRRDTLW